MGAELYTSIKINTNSKSVWEVLTDFERYSEWNPFIKSVNGDIKVGNIFHAEINGMKFKPTVLVFEENKEFRWIGKLGFKWIFSGEHRFVLHQNDDGTTTLEHAEIFNGFLLHFMKKKLLKDTRIGFEAMNEKLKIEAEK